MLMSARFQTAFKIALAMTLAYGVSLALDWDNPHWAGFSIAFCSLATVGESLLKGLLRTFGTFAAIFVSLSLLALFPQDRWVFALCVSLWVAFCTWMMHGNSRWYFWFCAGLGVPILSMLSGGESLGAFEVVVLRAQETILGTLAFTLVSSFVFPTNSRGVFEDDMSSQVAALHDAFLADRTVMLGKAPQDYQHGASAGILREASLRQAGMLGRLDAAALDSFEIAETRSAWRRGVVALGALVDALERWRLGLSELEGAEPLSRMTGLSPALTEILRRFEMAADLLAGRTADGEPRPVTLILDQTQADKMSAFHRAALSQTRRRLLEIERASRDLLIAIADVRGLPTASNPPISQSRPFSLLPDPERIAGTLRAITGFWLAFLSYVFIPDVPSWVVLIATTTAISMLMMMAPTLPLRSLAKPAFISILFGGSVHILIMPHLTGFASLGATIFVVTFAICWICHTPQQGIGRSFGLAFFATQAQIGNPQDYSFTFVANLAVAFLLVLVILAIVAYFPVSFRPEQVFLRLIRRYFGSATELLETLHLEKRRHGSWLERQRRTYHACQLATIPGRLTMWTSALPDAALATDGRASAQELVVRLSMLGDRMRDLMAMREVDHAQAWVREALDEVRSWRLAIQGVLGQMTDMPEDLAFNELQHKLSARMDRLEALIADAIERGSVVDASEGESENLFRELGGFRGVSEALISVAGQSSMVDWPRLREARL
jgi:uncharacterized membrane protein YccC